MEHLRNRQSVVASGQDGTAPRKFGPRVTSMVYTLILIVVVVYVVFYIQNRVRFFRTTGIVATSVTPVASKIDGRVVEIRVSPGDTVRLGDPLMTVEPALDCAQPDTTRLVNMALDLRLARARREIVASRVAARRERAAELAARRGLELGSEFAAERSRLDREIEELDSEHTLLGTEVAVRQQALNESSGSIVSTSSGCNPETVYSPLEGILLEVHHEPFSVLDAGTAVLSLIHHTPDVRIVAETSADQLRHVYRGKEVRVRFSDGSEDIGVVENIRGAADVVDMLDLGSYRLPESEVVTVIRPRDPDQGLAWREYDRLLVEVIGRRGRR